MIRHNNISSVGNNERRKRGLVASGLVHPRFGRGQRRVHRIAADRGLAGGHSRVDARHGRVFFAGRWRSPIVGKQERHACVFGYGHPSCGVFLVCWYGGSGSLSGGSCHRAMFDSISGGVIKGLGTAVTRGSQEARFSSSCTGLVFGEALRNWGGRASTS